MVATPSHDPQNTIDLIENAGQLVDQAAVRARLHSAFTVLGTATLLPSCSNLDPDAHNNHSPHLKPSSRYTKAPVLYWTANTINILPWRRLSEHV